MPDAPVYEFGVVARDQEVVKHATEQGTSQWAAEYRNAGIFRRLQLKMMEDYYRIRNARELHRVMLESNNSFANVDVAREVASHPHWWRRNPTETPGATVNANVNREQFNREGSAAVERVKQEYRELLGTRNGVAREALNTRESRDIMSAEGVLKQDIMRELINRVSDTTTPDQMHEMMRNFARRYDDSNDALFAHRNDQGVRDFLTRFGRNSQDLGSLSHNAQGYADVFAAPEAFLKLAKDVKADMVIHGRGIDDMDNYIRIIVANPQWAHATETQRNVVDHMVSISQNQLRGVISPETMAAVASLATFFITREGSSHARDTMRLAAITLTKSTIAAWAVGTAVGASLAAMRRWYQVKKDITTHRVAMAYGGMEPSQAAPRNRPNTHRGPLWLANARRAVLRPVGALLHGHFERRQAAIQRRLEEVVYDMASVKEMVDGGGEQIVYADHASRGENPRHVRVSAQQLIDNLSNTDDASQRELARRAGEIIARLNLYTHGSRQGVLSPEHRQGVEQRLRFLQRRETTRDVINFGSRDTPEEGKKSLNEQLNALRTVLVNTVGETRAIVLIQQATRDWTTALERDIHQKERAALNHKAVEAVWSIGYSVLASATFGIATESALKLAGEAVIDVARGPINAIFNRHSVSHINHAQVSNVFTADNKQVHLPQGWKVRPDVKHSNLTDIYDNNGKLEAQYNMSTHQLTSLSKDIQINKVAIGNEFDITNHSQDMNAINSFVDAHPTQEHLFVDPNSGLHFFLPNGYDVDKSHSDLVHNILAIREDKNPPIFHYFKINSVDGKTVLDPKDANDSLWLAGAYPQDHQAAWSSLESQMTTQWQESNNAYLQEVNNYTTIGHHHFSQFVDQTGQYAGYELYGHWGDGRNWANGGAWFNQRGTLSYGAIITDQPIPADLGSHGVMGFDTRLEALIKAGILPKGSTTIPQNIQDLLKPESDPVLQAIAHANGGIIPPDHMLAVVQTTDGKTLWLPIHKLSSGVMAAELPKELQTPQGTPNELVKSVQWGFVTDNTNGHEQLLRPTEFLRGGGSSGNVSGQIELHVVASKDNWEPSSQTFTLLQRTATERINIDFTEHVTEVVPSTFDVGPLLPFFTMVTDPRFLPKGLGGERYYGYYGSGEFGLLNYNEYKNRRSETLLKNPNAKLDERKEFAAYMRTKDREYLRELNNYDSQLSEDMSEDCRIVVTIPAYSEGRNIRNTLNQYLAQKDKNGNLLNPNLFEIVIVENHPSTVAKDTTEDEINAFKRANPNVHVRYIHREWKPNEKVAVGNARRYGADLTILRANKRSKSIGDLIIVSGDADVDAISEHYLIDYINAFDSNPGLDAAAGKWNLPESALQKPNLRAAERMWHLLDRVIQRDAVGNISNRQTKSPGLIGRNAAVRAKTFAAIGGYNEHATLAEDLELGWMINAARGDNPDRFTYINSSEVVTLPRRFLAAMVQGVPLIEMYGGFTENTGVRGLNETELLNKIPDTFDPARFEKEADALWINGQYRHLGHRFQEIFDRTMHLMGVEYVIDNGHVRLTNTSKLEARLRQPVRVRP